MVLEAPNVRAHLPTVWQVHLSGEAVALVVWTEVVVLTAAAVVGAQLGVWLIAPLWQAG